MALEEAMRRLARRDAREGEIIDALQAIGVVVRRVSSPGIPDLLTWRRGGWLPVEVKSPGEPLTPAQQELYDVAPFPVVETVAEALALFGVKDTTR